MRIKRTDLERIVREELLRYVKALVEGTDKEEPEKQDAADANKEKEAGKKPDPKAPDDADEPPGMEEPGGEKPEVPDEEDPSDDDLAKADAEPGDDREGGKVHDEVVGKRVQAITMEPKSKILPGAQELVLTFDESPDPLRILITKTGAVKFFYRGLHDTL